VLVFSVFGALMFGAAEKLENVLLHSRQEPNVLILRMNKVLAMDSTALNILEHLHKKLHKRGIRLILSGPHTQPYVLMENSGFLDQLGRDNVAGNVDEALAKAQEKRGRNS
jgi:SulP family sulfate permease